MSIIKEIGESSELCFVQADSEELVSKIWFKSQPIDRRFLYRAAQLQLQTDSRDHGHLENSPAGAGSWFELVVLKDAQSEEERKKDGKPLVFRSHDNRMDPLDNNNTLARHFGVVFDRRQELLDALELGNVIAVRVCVRSAGWQNYAQHGRLIVKLLNEDLFCPMSWTLSSGTQTAEIPKSIDDGVYSLVPSGRCHVESKGDDQKTELWFTTPVFQKEVIPNIEDVQLITQAHHEGVPADDAIGTWCWFDLVVLENAEATQPRIKDGRALVWKSHDVPRTDTTEESEQIGKVFGKDHELLSVLEASLITYPGNVIAVRACARFPNWELDAHFARLVIRIANGVVHTPPPKPAVDWKAVSQLNRDLLAQLKEYLDDVTPEGEAPALSVEATLLRQELRADRKYGSGGRPLRLLSLDGGGVRGISSLHVLKAIMLKITGNANARPCDYFDMMAGTSTGGLIAIMLGRLRMTIDECIAAYEKLAAKIFDAGLIGKVIDGVTTGARYSKDALEEAIKEVMKQYTGDPNAPMKDPKEDSCKVFVLATRADDISNRVATHLRTYENKNVERSFDTYKIWEAARATSAAPTYFPRIKLDEYEYVDGGVGFNNPVLLLMGEARLHYGFARPFGCLVTIGTGMTPNVEIGGLLSTVKGMWELSMKTEHANKMAEPLCEKGTYYRFNVGEKIAEKRWVETVEPGYIARLFGAKTQYIDHFTPENWVDISIDLADYKHMGDFVRLTKKYIATDEEQKRVSECAQKLK
ncbi:phospholipase [Agrocybe pediades]|nr:phospholipase [Agrocybe pediades]